MREVLAMPTYVSVVNWSGEPQPSELDVRAAVLRHETLLRRCGLRSVQMVPGERVCTGVMISNVPNGEAAERLARAILPDAATRIESMRFDDESNPLPGNREAACPPPPRDYLEAVLEAVVSG